MKAPLPLTDEVFLAHLKCRYKAYLKFTGAVGEPSDYEKLQRDRSAAYENVAREAWLRDRPGTVLELPASLPTAVSGAADTIVGVALTDAGESCRPGALERARYRGAATSIVYQPVRFTPHERITAEDRLLLGFDASIMARVQGVAPAAGKIVHGTQFKEARVALGPVLKQVNTLLDEIRSARTKSEPPRQLLNRHCPECEFRNRCLTAATEKDDLSLLRGISPKEIAELNRRGIFTVMQYSYTFGPGKLKRLIASGGRRTDHALQALAIREKTVYVVRKQALLDARVRVYLDVEGLTESDSYYLIGLRVVESQSSRCLSLWADGPADVPAMWQSFLQVVREAGEDFVLYHYGSYESRFLRRMADLYGGEPELLRRVEARSVNVLALIYGRVFFPVHSNDLKSIAGFLGFRWSEPEPSGLQAIVWRYGWESTRDEHLKQKLLTYNQDDCAALQTLVGLLHTFGEEGSIGSPANGPRVAGPDDIQVNRGHKFCDPDYVLPEFSTIAKCAYFDYQRDRVLFRTSRAVRQAKRRQKSRRRLTCKINQIVEHTGPDHCPHCGSDDFKAHDNHKRLVVDLKPVSGGLKRWVTQHKARRYLCRRCGGTWMPDSYLGGRPLKPGRPQKYGWTLSGWVAYATVALRHTNEATVDTLEDLFGVRCKSAVISSLRRQAAERYQATYQSILNTLRGGPVVHADETWAKIRRGADKGYVWVFASPEAAIYLYSPTRDGDVLRETLSGFRGVLVSDFYAPYDAQDCAQQKCIVHLVWDLNDDLVKYPFDEELKGLAARFGALMQAVVQTIDRYGLKKHHLHKHRRDVDRFYAREVAAAYTSAPTQHYQRRLVKYRDKLFTFLDHDGVPWNNNCAENAVKRFVSRRKGMGGTGAFTEDGLRDYLLLLSIYQTLRYRGINFWHFLRSGSTDIEAFVGCQRRRARRRRRLANWCAGA